MITDNQSCERKYFRYTYRGIKIFEVYPFYGSEISHFEAPDVGIVADTKDECKSFIDSYLRGGEW